MRTLFIVLVLAGSCLLGTEALAQQAAPPEQQTRLALLIGVGKYAQLGPSEQLDGCQNDVVAMHDLLRTRFRFRDEAITRLVDEAASGDRIRAELRRLVERVQSAPAESGPAMVVLHFSGHGSQVLDQPAGHADRDEEDGLDETLVPHDATKQGGPQDLRDDELYRFVEELCAGGRAKLWLVLDCCHSGSGARGATKVRQLVRAPIVPDNASTPTGLALKRLPAGAVFLSACRAKEVEPEYQDGGRTYGLLTRFLVQVLNEESAVSKLSYDLLRQSIVARYRADRSVSQAPMPTLEYGDPNILNETVVAGVGLDRRPLWEVQIDGDDRSHVRMTAGSLHGVTPGSHFELYDRPERVIWDATEAKQQPSASVGWLEVERVEGASSLCRVFRYERGQRVDGAALDAAFKQGFAVERHREYGEAGLKVRVVWANSLQEDGPALNPGDESLPESVKAALTAAARPNESKWLTWTTGAEACDVVLRLDGNYAALFPATGVCSLDPAAASRADSEIPRSLVGGWGPIDLRHGAETEKKLLDFFRRIVRARNLIQIATRKAATTGGSNAGGDSPVQVALELIAVDAADDNQQVTKSHAWPAEREAGRHSGQLVMRDGDRYTLRVVNREPSGKPVFITVLHIDGDMGIDPIHPYQAEAGAPPEGRQKLEAGQSLQVDGYFVCNDDDNDKSYGPRWAIVLATRTPNDFFLLAQQGLPVTRDAVSPLEDLLQETTSFRTRGGFTRKQRPTNRYDDSWGSAAVRWLVVPGSASKQ